MKNHFVKCVYIAGDFSIAAYREILMVWTMAIIVYDINKNYCQLLWFALMVSLTMVYFPFHFLSCAIFIQLLFTNFFGSGSYRLAQRII